MASEDRLEILKMVQNGKITADEGARLLEALGKAQPDAVDDGPSVAVSREPRLVRIRVTDLETGRQKVEFQLPWNLVNVGVNMGARVARKEIGSEEFIEAVRSGALGKVMDVKDEEQGERVEIFVE